MHTLASDLKVLKSLLIFNMRIEILRAYLGVYLLF